MSEYLINVNNYNYNNWNSYYENNESILDVGMRMRSCWSDILIETNEDMKIDEILKKDIKAGNKIFPYPDLTFTPFYTNNLDNIKVVFIGQDPYHNFLTLKNKEIPEAMGISFSVPVGIKVPSSLTNIYNNLKKFNHMDNIPKHGNLQFWDVQGCLMLNTSLTVRHNEPNCHSGYWNKFTDEIIKKISNECENVVFVLWGSPAYKKINLIDTENHKVIVSSHPSGLSFKKPLKQFPSFYENDHFGQINEYLKEHNKREIIWKFK